MTGLTLTVTTQDLSSAVPWLFILAGVSALLAIIIALGPKPEPYDAPRVHVLDDPTDGDTDDVCPRCGGAGIVDWLDDWDRPIAYDIPCPFACAASQERV